MYSCITVFQQELEDKKYLVSVETLTVVMTGMA